MAPAAAAPTTSSRLGSSKERMAELKELLDADLITKVEYEAKRKQILDAI